MSSLHRIYVTICRLRASWGFGVHSPNVYGLLTDVLRERRPYYAYESIERLSSAAGRDGCSVRVNKLLFRLVNRFRPEHVLEVGDGDGCGRACMSMARRATSVSVMDEKAKDISTSRLTVELGEGRKIGFLHITQTAAFREIYEAALPLVDEKSLFIIEGVRLTKEMCAWWKQVEQDARTGITIDLYDVGLVFFDRKCPRRNYRFNL